ncbi:amino acid adenylation domain-containing protein, partial [Mucilaginibacter calamicampi]
MKNEILYVYPATSLQKGFIYHALSQANDDAYRQQILLDYHQPLDIEKYIEAWECCIAQYPILRTAFDWEEDIIQIIYKYGKLYWEIKDVSHLATQAERDEAIAQIQVEDRKQGFDLTQPTQLRVYIIKQSEDSYTILKSDHHIITDGWSLPIVLTSVHHYYGELKNNKKVTIRQDEAYISTLEYILDNKDTSERYWEKTLAGVAYANDISSILSAPVELNNYQYIENPANSTLQITGDRYHQLKAFCQQAGITMNVVVQFLWHKLLQVHSGDDRTITGTTVSGRELPVEGIEASVGLYINTLPLVVDWDNDNSITGQLKYIHQQIADLNANTCTDLANLQKAGERLFHSLFVFENYPIPEGGAQKLELSIRDIVEKIDYPLSIMAYDQGEVLSVKFCYDLKCLTTEKALIHLQSMDHILSRILENHQQSHRAITLLNKTEYDKIIHEWNVTDNDFPQGQTIQTLFEQQANLYPDNGALFFEDQQLTYRELNSKSNQLARHIRAQYLLRTGRELTANTMIALCVSRSLEMVTGIMGILKAGAAYVPVDVNYPGERIDYILDDCGAEIILCLRRSSDKIEFQIRENRAIYIDLDEALYDQEENSNLPAYNSAGDLAYVIYTSGTTGKPKGVLIEHSGVVNLVYNSSIELGINSQSVHLQYASVVFDASVYEVFNALLRGAALAIVSDAARKEDQLLIDFITRKKITHAILLPALVNSLPTDFKGIDTLILGGEQSPPELIAHWSGRCRLINAYGPTEITVCATMHEFGTDNLNSNIGKPISNTKLYVLDGNLNPLPVGATGELYISGAGVARGYLNRPELTVGRFMVNPFTGNTKGYERMYKSGDLVRWLEDGSLEFIGRNDEQVKVRGYRIELGEIENALVDIEGIKQSCVITKERKTASGTNKYLVGYYVADSDHTSENELEIIKSWELLYDTEYDKTVSEDKMEADIGGWNSFINQAPIPEPDMLAWREAIVTTINSLKPSNVLEIGVGTGLLMYPLLDHINSYVGIDISKSVIYRHKKALEHKTYNTEFYHLNADEIDLLPQAVYYDTVIINSVCQYFPGIEYFETVVDKAIAKLTPGGAIFLGDIRNFDLHKKLIEERFAFKGDTYTQQDIDLMALKENEFLISPRYFKRLARRYKNVEVTVLERQRTYTHELSEHRYDVVIVNKKPAENAVDIIEALGSSGGEHNIPFFSQINQEQIYQRLAQALPAYMIPDILVPVLSLPLTHNGKIDKRALPDPYYNSRSEVAKPVTDLEMKLLAIYGEVLGIPAEQIGTDQDFFRIGGNSIQSILLKGRLNKLEEFKHISVADIFKYKSVDKLVQSLDPGETAEYKLQENSVTTEGHEIAIIGMSGAFSGADDPNQFWQLIANQQEGISFYSKDECKALGADAALIDDPNFIPSAGKIKDVDLFDPAFWDMSLNEASELDPQTRKYLEHSWLALEASGYAGNRKQHNIGTFAGNGLNTYFYDNVLNGEGSEEINMWAAAASNINAIATKTAYLLGLSGPANTINTACSTGLVTVIEACKNLQLGTCDMAMAGGVGLAMRDKVGYIFQEGMVFSKDGHCRTFDKNSSGTTIGSGVGVLVLKRIKDAVRDNDRILGVIKGYCTNNDGDRKTSFTSPSLIGQSECIVNAQKMSGLSSEQIEYVECHGTGTHLGDPIEVQALKEAFAFNRSNKQADHKALLGAVKANIGHADAGAGVAGLIKVILMLQNNIIPGQVNYNEPNPELNLKLTGFEINQKNQPWPVVTNKQRIAGVSSFGIGGTNAHLIVGDYIEKIARPADAKMPEQVEAIRYIIPVSAKSRQSLSDYKLKLIDYINTHEDILIKDLAHTLQRRAQFPFRSAYSARSISELMAKVNADNSGSGRETSVNNNVIFLFPGQGAQYVNMAKGLYEGETAFKKLVDDCIAISQQYLETDLTEVVFAWGDFSAHNINETHFSQISLFIIEYALAKYIIDLGVEVDAFAGHSIGEYVAATLTGVFKLEDAIKLVIARGRLMNSMQPGAMLSISAEEKTVLKYAASFNCNIAVINSKEDFVVSGTKEAINALKMATENDGIPTVILKTSHAFHSPMMEQAAIDFEKEFSGVKLNAPERTFISNLSGEIAGEEVTTQAYWCDQLRNTVQFSKGVNTLLNLYNQQVNFVEVGPGKGLSALVRKHDKGNTRKPIQTTQLLPSGNELLNNHGCPQLSCSEDLKALLWEAGIISLQDYLAEPGTARVLTDLPTYQFDFKRCWLEKSVDTLKGRLTVLPAKDWLSSPKWSALKNLNRSFAEVKTKYSNAIVFLREEQIPLFDLHQFSQSSRLVVLSMQCDEFQYSDDSGIFSIKPDNEQHFEALAADFKKRNIVFDAVMHLSSVDNLNDIDEQLAYSFYSLFLIREKLLKSAGDMDLLVLTNGLAQITNQDTIHAGNGMLVGAVRNINHEFQNINAKIIDVGTQPHDSTVIAHVASDAAFDRSEDLLAIRFGKLWKETYEMVAEPSSQENNIKDGDTILITGGLGGIALATAKYISEFNKVNFILVGRMDSLADRASESAGQKNEIIKAIKDNGSTVALRIADIANEAAVQQLFAETGNTFDAIDGIIHTAGATALLTDKCTLENIKKAFSGKVYGIENIMGNIDVDRLRYVAFTSSLASVMGDVNRIEYCAANSYLDFLCVDTARFKNAATITVNWPGWMDTGMAKGHKAAEPNLLKNASSLEKLLIKNVISETEGAGIFYALINQSSYRQVAVSKIDLAGLKKKLFAQSEQKAAIKQVEIVEANYSENEAKAARVFAGLLGLERISVHDDFFSLGGNSITAIKASHSLSAALGKSVKIADLFLYKTISKIVLHCVGVNEVVIPKIHSSTSPLSYSQERLWFIEQYEGGTNAYHIPALFELSGETDAAGIKHALRRIVDRHEVLRSMIGQIDEEGYGVQQVHTHPLEIEEVTLGQGEDHELRIREDINRPFDLSREYPVRVKLYHLAAHSKKLLLVNAHHIASDGWSMDIFQRELLGYYEA